MEKDDNNTEGADLSQENGGEQSGQENSNEGSQDQHADQQEGAQEGSQGDYRGKLNATNRFLEKEGYEFKDGGWQKKPAAPVAAAPAAPAATPSLSRDEAILIAKGLSEEEVEYAKKVATLQGVKVTDAVNDDLFKGWKAKKDKEAKDAEASLPPSRGARSTMKKTFNTPGLTPEAHKELFNERLGK